MFNAASTGLGFLSKIGTTNSKHVDGIYEGFSNVDGIFFSLVDTMSKLPVCVDLSLDVSYRCK